MPYETNVSAEVRHKVMLQALMWLLFATGLALQLFSPHLAVEHNSFVIPASASAPGSSIDPRALVQRQRYMQGSSALLVVLAVIGLGIQNRKLLSQSLFRR